MPQGSCKIYFDGHLPISKRPTRQSRLNDSLSKLKKYHSLHPYTLNSSAVKQLDERLDVFSPTATYIPRTAPLPAPPFILAATIEVLSAHSTYSATVCTVPGEAESYCARDAISTEGIVLTGDSDLLLFASPSGVDWGVMMFRDISIDFPGPSISTVVFRPTAIAKSLGVDLTFLGFLTQCDPQASFSTLQQRAIRIAERKKSGAAVEEYGRRWREFLAVYTLPLPCDPSITPKGVEPRIAEIIQQRESGPKGEAKTMYLPFLWEDPTRGSAWDAGRRIRAATYSLLFPGGDRVEEVCRRGQRIAEGLVERVEDPDSFIRSLVQNQGEKWWTSVVLNEIIAVSERRGQRPPEKSLLQGVAYMFPRSTPSAASTKTARKWTWERIQIYAMAQAAWYSLLLLKEVISTIPIPSDSSIDGGDWRQKIKTLPGVADCIDGNRFTDGITISGEDEKQVVKSAILAYHARVEAVREEEEEAAVMGAQMDVDVGSSSGSGNGKRPSDSEPRMGEKEWKIKKKRGRGGEGEGAVGEKLKGKGQLDSGNMFAALAE